MRKVGVQVKLYRVAPLAGAWIETGNTSDVSVNINGRTPRGCVD